MYNNHSLKKKYIIFLIKTKNKIITSYIIMSNIAIWKSGWKNSERVPENCWRNPYIWDFYT